MESLSAEVAKLREEQSLKRKQSEEEQIQQNENRKKEEIWSWQNAVKNLSALSMTNYLFRPNL
jgi:hypothetical protein